MTSTSVVGGIATLGTPEPVPDCDCATPATGSMTMTNGIMNFIGSPLDSVLVRFQSDKSTTVLLWGKKITLQRNTL